MPLTVRAGAPWLEALGVDIASKRLEPALAARVSLLFDETKADLRHNEEWEAIIPLTGRSIDVDEAVEVDFDDRDFTDDLPDGAIYVLPSFDITATGAHPGQARSQRSPVLEAIDRTDAESRAEAVVSAG